MLSLNAIATAPDSSSFTYSWDINGTSESGQSVLYYFQNPGNYSIRVTVTDSLGASATVYRVIEVLPQESNSSIAISYTRSVNGPMDYYTIKVHCQIEVSKFTGCRICGVDLRNVQRSCSKESLDGNDSAG